MAEFTLPFLLYWSARLVELILTSWRCKMRANIFTRGFFINTQGEFGVKMDDAEDSYVVEDGKLIINAFNGVYQYPEVHSLGKWGKWLVVPPQSGTYSGPAAGLDRVYGLGQNIVGVYDIKTSLQEKEFPDSWGYQKARHQAGLPLLGFPFDKFNPSIPELSESEEEFIEMEMVD
jgi:hypothetical protein